MLTLTVTSQALHQIILPDSLSCKKLYFHNTDYYLREPFFLNPNPIGGGGAFMAPPVIFFAVHLDRLEFRVQTSWLFSLKSPAYFDI